MEALTVFAEWFIGLFNEGGKTFVGFLTGIVPTLVALMTAVYAIKNMIGEERVNKFAQRIGGNIILRYTLLPIMAVFFLTNPMAYTFGTFLPERYKPAFYDAAVSFVHPILGLFPHANPAELFVYMGIANGIQEAGFSLGALAIRYFIVGVVVIFIRGLVTERITVWMMNREGVELEGF
ncbi:MULTISPECIES: PTS glucitol/sorbitol transporter subunit IIC [unclassified Halanaerobium]|uniref:PTS glucitol/sorbitol transporter subunit IIC n=1 Tax=unclassified Halanaerobium TaxID=2641197 RepID=UPI000DF12D7F|nr:MULTISPECIES: PTS glucitol/sorbitol transporter subunit IIC [unclassified Halanaerobium]RCW47360.1 PTS system glucitol/sorbitol-specific IIC component [Halanaerobium sp. MA284_MarDTE_T2]RCW84899.1 PTS system glucitol/sorbitol-specific IIC component [Halanaerobium sp. DL-01]